MNKHNSLEGVSILVTGASGFIGTHLCRALIAQGATIHATSRSVQTPQEGISWWQSNLESQQEVDELLDATNPEIVFHLAGHITASQAPEMVQSTFQSLLQSTLYILQGVTTRKYRRLILTGSLNEPVGDVDAVPNSPYSAAKWMSCGYARMFHKLYKTPVVIVRLFMGYGPGQSPKKVIPSIINSFLKGEAPQLTGGGFTTNWIYIEDIISGVLAAATTPGVEGSTFDLASEDKASVKEIVYMLKEILNSPLEPCFGALPDRQDEHTRVPDIDYSFKALGWRPKMCLSDGLRKALEYQRQQLQELV